MKNNEEIIEAYQKYIDLVKKYFTEDVGTRLDDCLGERLAIAPRGLTIEDGGYFGGLVDYAIKVAKKTKHFAQLTDHASLVRVALVHELGKLGDDVNEQFVQQESSWHVEKLGQHFKYNPACEKMAYSHRTLYFLSNCGFRLNTDEWIAILTSTGFHIEEIRFYAWDGEVLSDMLQA
jgi:hypothetical protein